MLLALALSMLLCCASRFVRGWMVTLFRASEMLVRGAFVGPDYFPDIYRTTAKTWAEDVKRLYDINVDVTGLDNIPSCTPVLYICNHQSSMDVVALVSAIPGGFSFM